MITPFYNVLHHTSQGLAGYEYAIYKKIVEFEDCGDVYVRMVGISPQKNKLFESHHLQVHCAEYAPSHQIRSCSF